MDNQTLERLLAYSFAAIVVLSGCGFIAFRQPVHSALSFASAVLASAGLYLLQDAPYVAAAMVAVYAGATIIIFLFALMFAQRSRLQAYDQNLYQPRRSLLAASLLAGILFYAIGTRINSQFPLSNNSPMVASAAQSPPGLMRSEPLALASGEPLALDSGEPLALASGELDIRSAALTPEASAYGSEDRRSSAKVVDLGREMYTRYLWDIEIAGTLLLIATVGAVLMAERDVVFERAAGGKV